ncbi:MAG: sigma-54 dependent transcriptional regulator [Deltaproteobacteria bacterium]|nr:sigma-54 dependent transcriptional regulator [Deltaproteobacteria bacterium]
MKQEAKKPVVLIVDDPERCLLGLSRVISPESFAPVWKCGDTEGLAYLAAHPGRAAVVIVDQKSAGLGGGGFLQAARGLAPQASFLVTGPLGPFLLKGGEFFEFTGPSLKNTINEVLWGVLARPDGNGKSLPPRRPPRRGLGEILGQSGAMNRLYELVENLAPTNATVLISGESGTGKELVAQTIHQLSGRATKPFVAVNCGAIPAGLMESELFGHERGSFTGAVAQRRGKFETAAGGTLFLDEVGELDPSLQVKLLRVLQEKEFCRVGGERTQKAEVRVLAATNRDLKEAVEIGQFREDLYYRLNVIPLEVPPLRDRGEDLGLLLEHFLGLAATEFGRPLPAIEDEAWRALLNHNYPGNVRELRNLAERITVSCPSGAVSLADLPPEVATAADAPDAGRVLGELPTGGVSLRQLEKELILKTLEKAGGNKAAAARMLGVTRRFLYLRLAEYAA